MTDFNDIDDFNLGNEYLLSDEERSQIWNRIETSLDKRIRHRRRGRFILWSSTAASVAAAVIIGLFFINTDKTGVPAPADGVVARTLSLTEEEPMEKLHSSEEKGAVTLAERNTSPDKSETLALSDVSELDFEEELNVDKAAAPIILYSIEPDEYPEVRIIKSKAKKEERKSPETRKKRERVYYADDYNPKKSGRRLSFAASTNISNRGNLGNESAYAHVKSVAEQTDFILSSDRPLIEPISKEENYLPLNFAVQGLYKVNESLSIGMGVSYSYLHSKFTGLIDRRTYDITQHIHYIGIPVNIYYNIASRGNFQFYVNGGFSVEKGVKLRYEMKSFGTERSVNTHVKGFQYSLNGGMGAEYLIGKSKRFGIYLEPNAVYYFESKAPNCIRTEQPFQVEAELGLRFHLK